MTISTPIPSGADSACPHWECEVEYGDKNFVNRRRKPAQWAQFGLRSIPRLVAETEGAKTNQAALAFCRTRPK